MKLRASFGVINTDRLPLDDDSEVTNYWEQTYGGGGYYPFDTNYSVGNAKLVIRSFGFFEFYS